MMRNGDHVIGLCQGMFEGNILTFNPGWNQDTQPLTESADVRVLQHQLKEQCIAMISETDESMAGPASFMVADSDSNTILFDQHR